MKIPTLKHKVYINAPVNKVFKTLTTGQGWDAWFTQGTELDIEKRKINLVWKDWGVDHESLSDTGEILEIVPDKKFRFLWHSIKYGTMPDFELKAFGGGTLLQFTETGYKENDLANFAMHSVGWAEALTLLKFYLEHGLTYGKVPKK